MMRRRTILSLTAWSVASAACGGEAKESEAAAALGLAPAFEVVDRDTAQIRGGMPEGVKVLVKRMPGDPLGARLELQTAIKAARDNVDTLRVAKSTFFSFADTSGVVLRSEIDPDRLVDQNILSAFPALKAALDPKSGLGEAYGPMEVLRGVKRGDDTAWVVAHPVVDGEGKTKGLFLTGWSFRLYARVVQDAVRAKYTELAKDKDNKKTPLVYAYFAKGLGSDAKAYGEPEAPDSLADHVAKLDVVKASASADFVTSADVDGRVFGIAARKAPALGDDAAIVIVASVY